METIELNEFQEKTLAIPEELDAFLDAALGVMCAELGDDDGRGGGGERVGGWWKRDGGVWVRAAGMGKAGGGLANRCD